MNLTELTDIWAEHTYGNALERCKEIKYCTDYEYNLTKQILKDLNLYDKAMVGTTVQNLNIYEREDQPIKFTNAFNLMMSRKSPVTQQSHISPVSYIINMIRECKNARYTDLNLLEVVVIPRGLRAFPSFIRELDLCQKLNNGIEGMSCRRSTPYEDAHYHIDLFMNYKNKNYLVWSYMCNMNPAKVQNLIDKISGRRTPIFVGTYLLCPFYREDKVEYNGWWFHPDTYINHINKLLQSNVVDNYDDIIQLPDLDRYLQDFHIIVKR